MTEELERQVVEYATASEEQRGEIATALLPELTKQAEALCFKILHDKDDDVVGDALLRAFETLPNWRPEAKFSTWFHRVVESLCLKKITRRPPVKSTEDLTEEEFRALGHEEATEEAVGLREAIEKLSASDQVFIKLVMDGRSAEELGAATNSTAGAVQKRWERLRGKLRGLMGG